MKSYVSHPEVQLSATHFCQLPIFGEAYNYGEAYTAWSKRFKKIIEETNFFS